MPFDFFDRAVASPSLWARQIPVEASLESIACSVVGGFFLERRIRAQGDLGGKDLRCSPRAFDVHLFEGDAPIAAVEFVLVDESLAAAAASTDTKAGKRVIKDDDFGLVCWYGEGGHC